MAALRRELAAQGETWEESEDEELKEQQQPRGGKKKKKGKKKRAVRTRTPDGLNADRYTSQAQSRIRRDCKHIQAHAHSTQDDEEEEEAEQEAEADLVAATVELSIADAKPAAAGAEPTAAAEEPKSGAGDTTEDTTDAAAAEAEEEEGDGAGGQKKARRRRPKEERGAKGAPRLMRRSCCTPYSVPGCRCVRLRRLLCVLFTTQRSVLASRGHGTRTPADGGARAGGSGAQEGREAPVGCPPLMRSSRRMNECTLGDIFVRRIPAWRRSGATVGDAPPSPDERQ